MTYNRIKWFILWTPTLTIALWEYLRHTFLLPYVSMDLGNALAPVIVMTVTATLLIKLFRMLESTNDSLQQAKAAEAAFMEREQLARELHDGISQSLFLLSVKLDKLEQAKDDEAVKETTQQLRRTVRHVYEDVRQSIASLRSEPSRTDVQWMQAVRDMAEELRRGGLAVELDWQLTEGKLSGKEKVELLAIVREAMLNVRKHANASYLAVHAWPDSDGGSGFRCTIEDDGIGAEPAQLMAKGRYGIRMMQDRAKAMGWQFGVRSPGAAESLDAQDVEDELPTTKGTVVEVIKEAER
ncbi:sensor histidine kinase [Paenibacillus sp. CF384]|uniref:sensor histidine kinase n=1 Tax=Paenibacillus sp. CF384 TaxID=1884382 RepID=UPI00089B7C9F|nr:histidine kinase [Paenibacillus sp. CF384]SDW42466.1 two-component system, NarL family, nitrate/nitrite sensor histidine kinase NarQ [Paenibacillus sp. CF384]